jgi:hypothetical protein
MGWLIDYEGGREYAQALVDREEKIDSIYHTLSNPR